MLDPGTLSVERARLPGVYEAARLSLAECSRIDECQTWADRAEALASYARQSQDDRLHRLCDRIQARAIRRAGELIDQIPPAAGRPKLEPAPTRISRESAAREAGLSDRQRKTALRVARILEGEFEAAVEGDDPPTVAALAARGRQSRWADQLRGRDPGDYAQATSLTLLAYQFVRYAPEIDLPAAVRGLADFERAELRARIGTIRAWLDTIEGALEATVDRLATEDAVSGVSTTARSRGTAAPVALGAF